MSRPIRQCRKTAGEVLSELHKIDEWDSDGGSGEDEPELDSVCDSETSLVSESENESDSKSEDDCGTLRGPGRGRGRGRGRGVGVGDGLGTGRGRGRSENIGHAHSDTVPALVVRTVKTKNDEQFIKWKLMQSGEKTTIRNNITFRPYSNGPSHAAKMLVTQTAISAFKLFFDNFIIDSIVRFSNEEAIRRSDTLNLTASELLCFVAILYCRGVFCQKSIAVK